MLFIIAIILTQVMYPIRTIKRSYIIMYVGIYFIYNKCH